MNAKVFVVLLVLLAAACLVGAGLGFLRDPDEGRDDDPRDQPIAVTLGSWLSPLGEKLEIGSFVARDGAGVEVDGRTATLTIPEQTTARFEIAADPDHPVRTADLEVAGGSPVRVLYWGEGDDEPDADQAVEVRKGGDPVALAVLEEGGTLVIEGSSAGSSVLTVR